MMCLDSNILIAFTRGVDEAISWIERARDKGEDLATTWINACELFKGAYYLRDTQAILGVHNLLSSLNVFLPTPATSELYAQLYAEGKKKGKQIADFDLIIAAIAIENNLVLVTDDRDFDRISSLSVKRWRN